MPFVHLHAPQAAPQPGDVCLAIHEDRLLAPTASAAPARLPTFADFPSKFAPDDAPLHVGVIEARPCWAVDVAATAAPPPAGFEWQDTRAMLGLLTPAEAQAVSCARQLLWWNRRHRFCGTCGQPTEISVEERVRRCPNCGALYFPTASPAIIVAVTRGDALLLARNRNFRPGVFSVLAGFVDPGETLEQAVIREVREEVGIEVGELRYVTSQPWAFPNSLMLGFRARHVRGEVLADGKELDEAAWFRRDALPQIPRVGTIARVLIDQWLAEAPA